MFINYFLKLTHQYYYTINKLDWFKISFIKPGKADPNASLVYISWLIPNSLTQ